MCQYYRDAVRKNLNPLKKKLLKKVKLSNQKFLSELYKYKWKYKTKLQIFFTFLKYSFEKLRLENIQTIYTICIKLLKNMQQQKVV